jgi:hypothetical protein
MKYHDHEKRGALLAYEITHTPEKFNQEPAAAGLPLASDRLVPDTNDQRASIDYSEEAIVERDPAYRLADATLNETQTVEHVPAAERLALARRLEQLGMSAARAAIVANL